MHIFGSGKTRGKLLPTVVRQVRTFLQLPGFISSRTLRISALRGLPEVFHLPLNPERFAANRREIIYRSHLHRGFYLLGM
jgi:hypothetical protein